MNQLERELDDDLFGSKCAESAPPSSPAASSAEPLVAASHAAPETTWTPMNLPVGFVIILFCECLPARS